jgi:uncharacterized membrane protein
MMLERLVTTGALPFTPPTCQSQSQRGMMTVVYCLWMLLARSILRGSPFAVTARKDLKKSLGMTIVRLGVRPLMMMMGSKFQLEDTILLMLLMKRLPTLFKYQIILLWLRH